MATEVRLVVIKTFDAEFSMDRTTTVESNSLEVPSLQLSLQQPNVPQVHYN